MAKAAKKEKSDEPVLTNAGLDSYMSQPLGKATSKCERASCGNLLADGKGKWGHYTWEWKKENKIWTEVVWNYAEFRG